MHSATITEVQQQSIAQFLEGRHIPSGLGTREEACSIAAINLALSGELTDEIPECMSEVIGGAIIRLQDAMPDSMRNSGAWRSLLPLAAGTGRDKEAERLAILLDWMWTVALPPLQPIAHAGGFGVEWRAMTTDKTDYAARAAAEYAAEYVAEYVAARAAARAAVRATDYAAYAEYATNAAKAAYAAAETAAYAANAARAATDYAINYWGVINPCELLRKLIEVK